MILLINPLCKEQGKHIHPPINLLSVAALPDSKGYDIKILDGNVLNEKVLKRKILKYDPKIVGFATFTGRMLRSCYDLSMFVKEHTNAKTVWGGVHATSMPIQTIKDKYVDIVALYEGDYTFLDLIKNINSLEKVKGIIYKEGKKIKHNPPREQADLTKMPQLPWHLVDVRNYINAWAGAKRTLPIMTSKGCPFLCAFCYNLKFNKQIWRPFAMDWIKNQIDYLVDKYNLDGIRLDASDNLIGTDPNHAIAVIKYVGKKGLKWGAQLRINQVNPKLLKLFKDNGLNYAFYGIESGSPRILRFINKNITLDQVKKIVNETQRLKIPTASGFMYDFPTETQKDLNMTLRLVNRLNILVRFAACQPYPGTQLYEYVQKNNLMKFPNDIRGWSEFEAYTAHGLSNIPNIKIKTHYLNFRYNVIHNSKVCLTTGNLFMLKTMAKSFAEYYISKLKR